MGLDQYAHKKPKGEDDNTREEFHYWRKHPAIQHWMEELWESKGKPNAEQGGSAFGSQFNCVPVTLTREDLLRLKEQIESDDLKFDHGGFFFGSSQSTDDPWYQEQKADDLLFVEKALKALSEGFEVEYSSWW